jgi:hypothetical protein
MTGCSGGLRRTAQAATIKLRHYHNVGGSSFHLVDPCSNHYLSGRAVGKRCREPRAGRGAPRKWRGLPQNGAWSRRAYRLAYASQRGTAIDRAHRGQAKIKARLIGNLDPDEWDLPPKPKWMRWHTYNRYVGRYDAHEAILDQGTFALVAKLMRR